MNEEILNLSINDETISELTIGCSWENPKETDIDLLMIMMDTNAESHQKKITDMIYYDKTTSNNNFCFHYGDDIDGKNKTHESDNELIYIDFSRINDNTNSIAIVLNNYTGGNLSEINNLKCRIYTGKPGEIDEIIYNFDINHHRNIDSQTVIIGYFIKDKNNLWSLKIENEELHAKNISEIQKHFSSFLDNYKKENSIINKIKDFFN
jgi:stress response protein SCP2